MGISEDRRHRAFSPVMGAVKEFAARGGLVVGICNGFQILCEAGLLPGALLRNKNLKFICEHINIRVEATDSPFTNRCQRGQVLSVPIAHGDGNYFCDDADPGRASTRESDHLPILGCRRECDGGLESERLAR